MHTSPLCEEVGVFSKSESRHLFLSDSIPLTHQHTAQTHTPATCTYTHTHTDSVCALAGPFIYRWAIVQGRSFALKGLSCVSSSKACERRHLQRLPLHIKTEIETQQSSSLEMQKKRSSYVWVMEQMSRIFFLYQIKPILKTALHK